MADDLKKRMDDMDKKHYDLARKVNEIEVRQKLQQQQITDLQKRGVDMDNRIKQVESK